MRTSDIVRFAGPLLIVLGFALAPAVGQPQYTASVLPTLTGGNSEAHAINDYGQIVGRADVSGDEEEQHAVVWQNGEIYDLHAETIWGRGPLIQEYGVAYGISNTDQIVGTVMTPSEDDPDVWLQFSFILRPGVSTDLVTPYPGEGVTFFDATTSFTGINRNGTQIVGWFTANAIGQIHALDMTPDGGGWMAFNDLGTMSSPDENSSATAVNNDGQIVGWSYSSTSGYAAFLYDGTFTNLGTLGGTNSWARDINDNGLIVGEGDTADWYTQPFLYDSNTDTMTPLGSLGGGNGSAAAINNVGQIVGWALNANGEKRGFLIDPVDTDDDDIPDTWFADADADGVNDYMYDLNTVIGSGLAVRITEGRDINDNGVIVGWGEIAGTEAQYRVAFVASPGADATASDATDDTDNTDTGGVSTNAGDREDVVLAPVDDGNTDTNDDTDSGGDTNDGNGSTPTALGPFHFLCGVGVAEMLPLMLLGLAGVHATTRTRRRAR